MKPSRVLVCGKRRYYSEAAFSVVEKTGLADPIEAMERLAEDLLAEVGGIEPPVNLVVLASFVGVVDVEEVDMTDSGRLVLRPDGNALIQVRACDPRGRRNFSCGHEIGHLLIPSYHENPMGRVDALTGEFCEKNEEEYLCDIAARTLLLPEALFRAECDATTPSITALMKLSDRFQSSVESVFLRLDQIRAWDCIPVVWELALKPTQKGAESQMPLIGMEQHAQPVEQYRVKFSAGKGAGAFFPRHQHIPSDSPMVTKCLSEGHYIGPCLIPTARREISCRVEAQALPYRNQSGEVRQRIVSLVFP